MVWTVARVKPKCEGIAIENLDNQGFKGFCPMIQEIHKTGPRVVPMFSGYLFVKIPKTKMRSWQAINNTKGILKLLCSAKGPSFLPNGFVEALIQQGDKILDFTKLLEFNPGDQVQIKNGPMQGQMGICKSSSHERIAILLRLLNRDTVVYFNKSLLTKVAVS